MTKGTIYVCPDGSSTVDSPPKAAPRRGEVIARTVAFVGGASLLVGGLLGYALGFLDGARDGKGEDHEV